MKFGIIVAGGVGSRMNMGNKPKQFMDLCGKPILIRTLEKFLECKELDMVYIGIHPAWTGYTMELIDKYIPVEKDGRMAMVPGGADRNSTLFNVIDNIRSMYGENESHIIVTHDAVRPFVTVDMIKDSIIAAENYGAAATVIPSTDTIMVSAGGEKIDSIPNRKSMFQAQTPQSFNMMKLNNLYHALSEEEKSILTDACGIFAYKDEYVHLTKGDVTNIKITTPLDLIIGEGILKSKE